MAEEDPSGTAVHKKAKTNKPKHPKPKGKPKGDDDKAVPRNKPKPDKPKPDPVPDEDEDVVEDPWEGFVINNAPGPGGGPPQADMVAPRGTKQWRRAVLARRKWEGDQLHRQAALTGGNLDNPEQLRKMLEDIGIWEFKPDDPNQISHKWKLWTGQLPNEGFGMTDVGPYSVPYASQAYMPDWKHDRDYAVQGGHLLKGAEAGTYISPQNDGTANVQDQFGNVIGNIPWPPGPPAPTTPPIPDTLSATDTGPTPAGGGPAPTAGFGMPTPGQVQGLTDSMAGFSPLNPTPAPGATTGGGAAKPSSSLSETGPTVNDTITVSRKSTPPRTSGRAFKRGPVQQQRQPIGWYSGFGQGG